MIDPLRRVHQPFQLAAALGHLVLLSHQAISFLPILFSLHDLDHVPIHKVLLSTAWIRQKKNADGSVFYYSWDLDVVEVQIMTQKTFVSLSASVPEQADPTEGKNTLYYFIFFSSFLTPLLLVPFIAHIKQTVTLWHTKIFMHYTSYLTMARNAHNELVKNLDSLAISLCMFYLFSSESLHEQNTKTIKQTKQKPQD